MPNLEFTEKDVGGAELEASVPEELLVDLLCGTQDSLESMLEKLDTLTETVAAMKDSLEEHLPGVAGETREVREAIIEKTDEGVEQSKEFVTAVENLIDELRVARGVTPAGDS